MGTYRSDCNFEYKIHRDQMEMVPLNHITIMEMKHMSQSH